MKPDLRPWLFGLAVAVLAHVVTIGMIPRLIMDVATKRIAAQSGGTNRLAAHPLTTPQNQRIVRPSPDLAYSTCALDVSRGPVRIQIGPAQDYASLAIYDSNTDNVFALNDSQVPANGARILVVGPRSPVAAAPGETVVKLSGGQGIALIRRLAPGPEAFARVQVERRLDRCGPL